MQFSQKGVAGAPHANEQWPSPLVMKDTHPTTGFCIVGHCGLDAWLNYTKLNS